MYGRQLYGTTTAGGVILSFLTAAGRRIPPLVDIHSSVVVQHTLLATLVFMGGGSSRIISCMDGQNSVGVLTMVE